ncbi:hypothetical protein PCANC_11418 [Puccinia coronata f. sp. avenae]|uniref:Uncharacterized protein n=1 Tax=Puccinia coronata f. sp. avenae TaxID=200324 RepID=A0A2N5SNJ6_9BASI|nr:hypothetical protein PCANC_18189 [Puccinia coronata f. sp. avenae]PLW34948.1 hypothetical protein PCASD_14251 [Puccinia coronata f. sp. avenae]PLW51207.1 hypothetical protein PCANC_11418 [Puccinia coronata f. sp. avenae]
MVGFTASPLTKSRHSRRYSSKIICFLIALFAPTTLSQSPTNDSYSYRDPKFVYAPRDVWRLDDFEADIAYTNYTGAKVTFSFFGSAVYLSSSKKADRYILQVIIDDVDKYNVSLNGPNAQNASQDVLWGVSLVEGNHTFQAINLGADPERPYVAFASLTITKGQRKNTAPAVSSQSFRSKGEEDDNHDKRNAVIRRATGVVGALVGFIALVVLGYGAQRRRHKRQLQQHLHNHLLATHKSNLSSHHQPTMHAPPESLRYVSIRPESSTYTFPTTHMDPAGSLLMVSEDRASPGPPSEKEDESEFWRPRKRSDSSN